MKATRRSRMLIALVLVMTMLVSVVSVGLVAVSAADAVSIDYWFKYQNAGYAEGRVTLSAADSADYGTYYLYWADDTKALDGYAEISALNLNKASKSVEFLEFTAIPADATKLIAIKSDAEPAVKTVAAADAVYNIPESKQFKYASSDVQYNFQALSDIHIQADDSYWVHSKAHWANALEVAAKRDADFITVCGDAVNGYGYSNLQKEWPIYLSIIAESSFTGPVFETNGNHEIKGNGGDQAQQADHDIFKTASGLNVTTDKMQSSTYYEMTSPTGDHFIFMTLEKSGAPNEYSEFSDEQLNWLEGLFDKYYGDGKKFIIFEHALTRNYGAGDDLETPYYKGGLLDSYNGTEHKDVQRFKSLLEEHPDAIWFSGHSHIDFKYNYNINNMNGTTAYTVHIPSTSSTTHPNVGSYDPAVGAGSTNYVMSEDSSQGYFVDMYDDAVVLNGTDLVKNEILPLYTYLIDYSDATVVTNPTESIPDVPYDEFTVTVDTTALVANPAGVKVTLYGADDEMLTKDVAMTKNADGTYSAKVSGEFTKMKFLVNNGTNEIKTQEYAVANCNVVLGAMRVEYSNPNSWSFVNAYVWSSVGSDAVGWPGMAMTKLARAVDGTYTVVVPEGNDMIIFNNKSGDSGSQTDDLAIDPYVVETIKGSYSIVETTDPTEASTAATETTVTETVTESTAATETTVTESTAAKETDPTEASTAATETIVTEPITTIPGPTEVVVNLYGDADLDGKVSVKDATLIQKYAADLATLDDVAFAQAEVTNDGKVNVRDATAIQKFVALLIDQLPLVDNKADVAEVGASASDLTSLMASVKTTLTSENYYASYVAYSNLKKAYYTYKDATVSAMSATAVTEAYNEINTALTAYKAMKTANPNHVNGYVPPAAGSYLIRGTMNNWDESGVMTSDGDGVSITYTLSAGTHKLKVYDTSTGTWYGNNGSFTDTCSGWTMKSDAGDLTFTATGGTYKFTVKFVDSKVKLTVTMV